MVLWFSHAGTNEGLALPALKRVIGVETLSQSAKALLPRINAGAPTHLLDRSEPQQNPIRLTIRRQISSFLP